MRASGRSVLLTTRITGSEAASALRSTKRVCGSGPSEASTSSTTPSTMDRPRSTSPPKSACPGVSMTLMTVTEPSGWCRCTAVFLARMVMPFSRSRSPESITRSTGSARSAKAPDWRSMASTSVVLPWSTCATMATLRKSRADDTLDPPADRYWCRPTPANRWRMETHRASRPSHTLPAIRGPVFPSHELGYANQYGQGQGEEGFQPQTEEEVLP
ncbi:Uncharacterised protein [Mycobacteroides abscessus subsp. abscessus]|nr:Uncharacterised protein [Mycobacteroides abscessus subsp. abscessus]